MADRSHHVPGRGFRNPWPGAAPRNKDNVVAWALAHRGSPKFRRDAPSSSFELVRPEITERLSEGELVLTWIGHSTFLLQIGPMNVLTDPVWGARVPPLPLIAPRRWVAPPVQITALPPIDAVLISHSHYDHLESASVRALSAAHPAAHWYVPLGIRDFVRKRGARHVHELDWYESTSNGEATFSATPAQHSSGRTPFDRAQTLWCGWAVTRGERRIYFAGDTAYFPGFPEIGQRYGPFDVALLPIGSTEPRSFMQYHHMNASDAVQAFQDLYSRIEVRRKPLMIPMHWGTYKLTIDPIDEPPQALRGAWSDAGLPNDQLRILRHGESEALTAGD